MSLVPGTIVRLDSSSELWDSQETDWPFGTRKRRDGFFYLFLSEAQSVADRRCGAGHLSDWPGSQRTPENKRCSRRSEVRTVLRNLTLPRKRPPGYSNQ